jgi:Protein of unknown function (DUF2934)
MDINPTNRPFPSILSDSQELEEKIRQRAYELYLERGQEHGHDVEDWMRAEQEIRRRYVRSMAA